MRAMGDQLFPTIWLQNEINGTVFKKSQALQVQKQCILVSGCLFNFIKSHSSNACSETFKGVFIYSGEEHACTAMLLWVMSFQSTVFILLIIASLQIKKRKAVPPLPCTGQAFSIISLLAGEHLPG